jgi:UDP-N-acetylglucosamine enolpyruvyl transferase
MKQDEVKEADSLAKQHFLMQMQIERLNQARQNLQTLFMLQQNGIHASADIYDNIQILKEVNQIGSGYIVVQDRNQTTTDILQSFSLNEKDIQNAIRDTNIFAVIRKAKENGYELKISDSEVALYKDGKRIDCADCADCTDCKKCCLPTHSNMKDEYPIE